MLEFRKTAVKKFRKVLLIDKGDIFMPILIKIIWKNNKKSIVVTLILTSVLLFFYGNKYSELLAALFAYYAALIGLYGVGRSQKIKNSKIGLAVLFLSLISILSFLLGQNCNWEMLKVIVISLGIVSGVTLIMIDDKCRI
ncbi:hypothetical protein [Phascolarctobacterium faecium]|uniref:hypothetical protein n=1 Tax=Phascolarctobacterium faecium TaxID=33025 RepID=UPI00300E726F